MTSMGGAREVAGGQLPPVPFLQLPPGKISVLLKCPVVNTTCHWEIRICADSLPLLQCIASRLNWNTPAFKATIFVTGKLNQIQSLRRTNIFDIINLPISNLMLHRSSEIVSASSISISWTSPGKTPVGANDWWWQWWQANHSGWICVAHWAVQIRRHCYLSASQHCVSAVSLPSDISKHG